jgi:hypothetical protein
MEDTLKKIAKLRLYFFMFFISYALASALYFINIMYIMVQFELYYMHYCLLLFKFIFFHSNAFHSYFVYIAICTKSS